MTIRRRILAVLLPVLVLSGLALTATTAQAAVGCADGSYCATGLMHPLDESGRDGRVWIYYHWHNTAHTQVTIDGVRILMSNPCSIKITISTGPTYAFDCIGTDDGFTPDVLPIVPVSGGFVDVALYSQLGLTGNRSEHSLGVVDFNGFVCAHWDKPNTPRCGDF
jgi:hypothetical protein